MKKGLSIDLSKAAAYLSEHEVTYMGEAIKVAHDKLHNKTGAGNDFLGWIDLPVNYDKEEFARIKESCRKNKKRFRCSNSYRNRWIISWCKSCNRNVNK